nr:MAG TPA: hypothetical protein [Bacteriophage sp.]
MLAKIFSSVRTKASSSDILWRDPSKPCFNTLFPLILLLIISF